MLDFSWSELALIAVVALIVIGPKDLPRVLRTAGVWVRKARSVSREFQSSIEQMMREAELDDVKKEFDKVASIDVAQEIEHHIDPTGELKESLTPPEVPHPAEMIAGGETAALPSPNAEGLSEALPSPAPDGAEPPSAAAEPQSPAAATPVVAVVPPEPAVAETAADRSAVAEPRSAGSAA